MKRCKKGVFLMTFFLGGSLLFSDQYAIQLGSFSDASKVPYTAQEIRNKGFSPVWQMDGAKEGMIRLLTGNYDWYWQAWTELAQIRILYPDAFICKVADDQPELQMLEKTGSARMIPDQIKIGPEPGSKELLAYYQSWAGSKNVAQARQILQGMDSRALSSDARAWREV